MKDIRQELVALDEATHTYKVAGLEDWSFSSVTEWISTFFKKFDSEAIAEKVAGTSNARSKYYQMPKEEILQLWKDIADAGTAVHKEIEDWILTRKAPSLEKAQWAIKWLEDKILTIPGIELLPEKKIFSHRYQLAGTIDLLCYSPGDNCWIIVDWKTNEKLTSYGSPGLHPATATLTDSKLDKYSLQLSVYRYLLEEEYGLELSNLYLVHLGDKLELIKVPYYKHQVIEMFRARELQQESGNVFSID